MATCAAFRAMGLSLVTSCLIIAPAWTQEAATGQASDSAPADVLKNADLKRSGSFWLLPDETTVLKDLRDAKALYGQVAQAMSRQYEGEYGAAMRKNESLQLREQSNFLTEQLAQYDRELDNLVIPPGGNYLLEAQRNQVATERNRLVPMVNQVNNRLNTLLEEQRGEQGSEQINRLAAETSVAREKYLQAVLDLRKSADEVMAKYKALGEKPEITKALEDVSVQLKAKQKLGPSKALQDAIKLLEKAEGTVKSEDIELQRESGVFHVYANLNKVPTKMVFDTGAGITMISSELAGKIGLKPKESDPTLQLKTADGTVVDAKRMFIPVVRVGKLSIPNVECAVMPESKGDVDPLLGQTFFKYFKVEFNPDQAKLKLTKLETPETEAMANAASKAETKAAGTAKSKRANTRQPRATTKTKRATPKSSQPLPTTPAPTEVDEPESPE